MTRKASLGAGVMQEPSEVIPGHRHMGGGWRAKRGSNTQLVLLSFMAHAVWFMRR